MVAVFSRHVLAGVVLFHQLVNLLGHSGFQLRLHIGGCEILFHQLLFLFGDGGFNLRLDVA